MHNRARPILLEQIGQQLCVCDVAMHKRVPRMMQRTSERVEIAGIRQVIEIYHAQLLLSNELADQATANKPRAASDKNRFQHDQYCFLTPRNQAAFEIDGSDGGD
jgi:hypothetical protein